MGQRHSLGRDRPAIEGGVATRSSLIAYGRQSISEGDIRGVVEVLRGNWLTTGPTVDAYERAFAEYTGAAQAVAVANGTAALHASLHATGIGPGDEVIVPALTFAATANSVLHVGAKPVFADVNSCDGLIAEGSIHERMTDETKAIIAVDFAGHPCDYPRLEALFQDSGVHIIADCAHSLGGRQNGKRVGTLASLNAFSTHPVKSITTGEGGVVTTNSFALAEKIKCFRNHGITRDVSGSEPWLYEIRELGFNYRLTDFQCALGLSQISRLEGFIQARQAIACRYSEAIRGLRGVAELEVADNVHNARHLFPVLLELDALKVDRAKIFHAMRAEGIGVQVHYIPVHLHPYYRKRFGTGPGHCPVAEWMYERILSLPLFPEMTDTDVNDVIESLHKVINYYSL